MRSQASVIPLYEEPFDTRNGGLPMARSNFKFNKRQRELAKKEKKEQKKQKKLDQKISDKNLNEAPDERVEG